VKVAFLSIGTELIHGDINDTNATFVSANLVKHGFELTERKTVADDINMITLAIRESLAKSDALVISGGLGPTQDDLTRQAIAVVMNVELENDREMLSEIENYFKSLGRPMAESNKKQADKPKGAFFMKRRPGTAPGLICPVGKKVIYALPGVPRELEDMFLNEVIDDLKKRANDDTEHFETTLLTWGITESRLADLLGDFIKDAESLGLKVLFQANFVEGIKIRLFWNAKPQDKGIFDEYSQKLSALLKDVAYSDDKRKLEEIIFDLLLASKLSLSVVESLTGGLICSRLVAQPGISQVLKGGLLTYQPGVKNEILNIGPIKEVSKRSAELLAKNVAKYFDSDLGLSITGVAGPESADGVQPGTVFIGIHHNTTVVIEHHFFSSRNLLREQAAFGALIELRKVLLA
jgi:nicotinamide-nucleotide amidase